MISPSCSGQTPASRGPVDGGGTGLAVGELKEVGDVPLPLGARRSEEPVHDKDGVRDVENPGNVLFPSEV